jgi:hypothetical protein
MASTVMPTLKQLLHKGFRKSCLLEVFGNEHLTYEFVRRIFAAYSGIILSNENFFAVPEIVKTKHTIFNTQ